MNQPAFRCEGDLDLFQKLLEVDEVKEVRKELEDNPISGVRRQLLATSLRLTESMSPRLHGMLHQCRDRLGIENPIETFVYNSPQFNAACVKPEDERVLLMFSSSLLERFQEQELLFVIGHELGHYLFEHTEIPIGYLVKGEKPVAPRLALQLFAWSRYAEISADRAGAMCTQDPDATARALFKLASGLTTDLIEIHIDDFAAQADEMKLETDSAADETQKQDWFLTHPFSPLRVKALQVFFQSELITKGGKSKTQLESETHSLMEMMSPTYLQEKTEAAELMRRVLFAAGCCLMRVSGKITEKEIEAFDSLFGEGTFGTNLDIDRLEKSLDRRIDDAVEKVPHSRRVHIIRDLCLIAVASGRVTKSERKYVYDIGTRLGLAPPIVEHCFDRDAELD